MESTFLDLLAAVSANRTVIAGLKARAILLADLDPADRRASQYVRDGFELHAHPDLEERLDEAAPGKPGGRTVGVYGFPVLVVESVIYAVAMGTSTIALRLPIGQIRADVLEHGGAADSVFGSDWVDADAWIKDQPLTEGTELLRSWVAEAAGAANDLAPSDA